MNECCESKDSELHKLVGRQRVVLIVVLWINLFMFLFEFSAGFLADSSALLADSLDMLGDTLVYGFSLYVLARSERWKSWVALFKGIIQAAFGIGVIIEMIRKILYGGMPLGLTMGIVGGIALVANVFCMFLLLRHREDDINMRSVWLCSRNDVIGNVGVIFAAIMVNNTGSFLPDILVGAIIAGIFLKTAVYVIKSSLLELNKRKSINK
ncbi:cation transporter [Candidatus Nitromaritima sp. SCGC AAA799-C22]|nr:cation transporter [Candidatus Nitromaritima sp. SCGC AAA799-C22]